MRLTGAYSPSLRDRFKQVDNYPRDRSNPGMLKGKNEEYNFFFLRFYF